PRLVVVEERVEGDAPLDGQPGVGDPLAQILERATLGRVVVDFPDPRLDRVEAGLRRRGDDRGHVQVFAADGAGVQAVAERLVGGSRARPRASRRLRLTGGRGHHGGADRSHGATQYFSTGQLHAVTPPVSGTV